MNIMNTDTVASADEGKPGDAEMEEDGEPMVPPLRQVSYWFGAGATERLGGAVTLRQASDGEDAAFADLAEAERRRAHLIFVIDTTGSMGQFIESLPNTLVQIFTVLSVLFGDTAEVSLLAYEDYSDGERAVLRRCVGKTRAQTLAFAKALKPGGGGDTPEASKTALVATLRAIRRSETPGNQTIVMHFTDAPPHHSSNFGATSYCNGKRESATLAANGSWDPLLNEKTWRSVIQATNDGPGFSWTQICTAFRREGIRVFSFAPRQFYRVETAWPFLAMLGELVVLEDTNPKTISTVTIDILMQLMGQFENARAPDSKDTMPSTPILRTNLQFTPPIPTVDGVMVGMTGADDTPWASKWLVRKNAGETISEPEYLLAEFGQAHPPSVAVPYECPCLFEMYNKFGEILVQGCSTHDAFCMVRYADGVSFSKEQKSYLCHKCEQRFSEQLNLDILLRTELDSELKGPGGGGGESKFNHPLSQIERFRQLTGLIPCTEAFAGRLMWENTPIYEPLAFMQRDLSELPSRFKSEAEFQAITFDAMRALMTPANVMALTSNKVFGVLWRLCAAKRDDKRLEGLTGNFSACLSSPDLKDEEKAKLRAWLEDSYDYASEINAAILNSTADMRRGRECGAAGESKGGSAPARQCSYLVLDSVPEDELPTVSALRSIGRSPSAGALASVQQVLSHLIMIELPQLKERPGEHTENMTPIITDGSGNCRYLPMLLDDAELFAYLPHLLRPGTKYSPKPAAMLAILVLRNSESVLVQAATRFLISKRGKWLPPVDKIDRPEILSYEFCNFISKNAPTWALTGEEKSFFDRLARVWRLRRSLSSAFVVECPAAPKFRTLTPDRKDVCAKCHRLTSLTLLDAEGWCGICAWKSESPKNRWEPPKEGQAWFCASRKHSYMTECTKCKCIYAVLGVEDLGPDSSPRCHFCRQKSSKASSLRKRLAKARASKKKTMSAKELKSWNKDMAKIAHEHKVAQKSRSDTKDRAPHRQCTKCLSRWISDTKVTPDVFGSTFLCPVCDATPGKGTQLLRVTLRELLVENPKLIVELGLRRKVGKLILRPGKFNIVTLLTKQRTAVFGKVKPSVSASASVRMQVRGKPILEDRATLVSHIEEQLFAASFEDTCSLCYDDFAVERLFSPCGLACQVRCCRDCLEQWYQANVPGKLYLESRSVCPFCRCPPAYTTLRGFNPRLSGIEGRCKSTTLSLDMYHGWCIGCGKVAPAVPRECAGGDLPELTHFQCEACRDKTQEMVRAALLELQQLVPDHEMLEIEARIQELVLAGRPVNREAIIGTRYGAEGDKDGMAGFLDHIASFFGTFENQCPRCGNEVYKTRGCNHMTCACGQHFCWCCFSPFESSSDTYSHLRKNSTGCTLWD